jgi:Ca2+:H+ antiporter
MDSSEHNKPQSHKTLKRQQSHTASSKYGSISDERKKESTETNEEEDEQQDSNEQSSSSRQDEDTSSDEHIHHPLEHELTLKDIQDVIIQSLFEIHTKASYLT